MSGQRLIDYLLFIIEIERCYPRGTSKDPAQTFLSKPQFLLDLLFLRPIIIPSFYGIHDMLLLRGHNRDVEFQNPRHIPHTGSIPSE